MEEMRNIERAEAAIKEAQQQARPSVTGGIKAMRPAYRPLEKFEQEQLENMKEMGANLWDLFDELGNSRETSLAKTNLEQAVMWAVKHLTR